MLIISSGLQEDWTGDTDLQLDFSVNRCNPLWNRVLKYLSICIDCDKLIIKERIV